MFLVDARPLSHRTKAYVAEAVDYLGPSISASCVLARAFTFARAANHPMVHRAACDTASVQFQDGRNAAVGFIDRWMPDGS